MTKRQFMEELRSSLEGMVSQAVIQENMNYYEDYINEQIRNGKNEQDVFNELGSPRLIARSIIDAKGEDDDYVQTEYYEEEQDEGTPEDMFGGNTHIFTMNSTKFKLGCLLSVIIFIFIIYFYCLLLIISVNFLLYHKNTRGINDYTFYLILHLYTWYQLIRI